MLDPGTGHEDARDARHRVLDLWKSIAAVMSELSWSTAAASASRVAWMMSGSPWSVSIGASSPT